MWLKFWHLGVRNEFLNLFEMNHHPFSQFHAFFSVSTILFGLANFWNSVVLISNEGKNMGWESFLWKTHLFWLWFWTRKIGFWTDFPRRNFFSFMFLGVGKQWIFSETHLLDCVFGLGYAMITKMENFLGMKYFFWERNKCFWNGDF